jgi:hypothetical protein
MLQRRLAALLLGALAAVCSSDLLAVDRYVAWLADGSRLTSRALSGWPVPGAAYRFDNHDLLAARHPLRLVRDRQTSPLLNAPHVVLANGDVINGMPVQLEPDGGRVGQTPRVRVQLEPPLMAVTGTGLAIRTDRVQRIVASAEAPPVPPPPGTVTLADGRRLLARSIRWREYGLAILTAGGIVEAAYNDLADVVFPNVDVTAAVLDDNLWAGGTSGSSIARFQTASGTVVTAARVSREQEQTRRRGGVTNTIYYYAQPAWADQPLAIPELEIVCCGYRAADEAPLALFPAEMVISRGLLGQPAPWTVNRSLGGKFFAAANCESDIGIAAHAHSEIAFDLPDSAVSLALAAGLDQSVGQGGCVRCKVLSGGSDEGRALWDSGVIQGKDGVKTTGPLDVKGLNRVRLVTETAHDERPPGADPFDIRDAVVWLSPLVKLDLSAGGATSRALAVLPGAAEWTPAGEGWQSAELASRWNVPASSWDSVLRIAQGIELTLTRKLHVTRACDVVELLTICPGDLDEHNFTLRVNGREVPWHNNADRNQLRQWTLRYSRTRAQGGDDESNLTDRLAYWWDLQAWRGKEIELELTLRGSRERNEIAWRGLSVRSAIGNLPEDEKPIVPDVRLADPLGRLGNPSHESVRLLGQTFENAWSLQRASGITFPLAADYEKFVAVVGCSQQVAGPVQVLIDERVVWERVAISSLTPAEQIEIAIPDRAKSLTLRSGSDGLYYGSAAFAEAGFVK